MPRNPKIVALQKAVVVEANYRKAQESLKTLTAQRKAAMMACVDAGCTVSETAQAFGISRTAVQNVIAQLRAA